MAENNQVQFSMLKIYYRTTQARVPNSPAVARDSCTMPASKCREKRLEQLLYGFFHKDMG